MTCESCGDKPKKCNKDFTKTVIEIDNPEQITLMRKVTIPASMGDDTTVPPVVGKYHNVLLYYEANQKSYLYSSDGIPTQLVNGMTDYEAATNLPQINSHTLIGNKTGAQLDLQNKLTAGANISIDSDNVISAVDTTYGPATDSEIGLVKPGNGLEVDANGTMSISDIEQYAHFFDTVADMKAADLADGSYARTLGYYSKNDGGGALYRITNNTPSGYYESLTSGLYAEIIINNKISTAQIGIVGDGTTDETTKLQSFFNINSEKYYVNNGNILIDGDINIPSNSTIEFSEDAKITRKATSLDSYSMFNIINKHDIRLVNIHLVGDRDTHIGSNGEWGYGINIAYSYNIEVIGATVEKTWGDGIYIGTSFTESKIESISNILCKDCRILNCSRNGISICAGKDIRIVGCHASGIDRVAPKAGMDIEVEYPVNAPENLENVYIENFASDNCDHGIQSHITQGKGTNIIIDGHHSDQDNHGITVNLLNYQSNIVYRNASITRFKQIGIYMLGVDVAQNSNVLIQNVLFDGTTSASNSAIWLLGSETVTTGNITIDDVTVQNTFSGLYEPELVWNVYWYDNNARNFSNIVLKNITDDAAASAKRYYTRGLASSGPNYTNCKIKRTISGTYYLADNYMNYITLNPATATTLVVNTGLREGAYTYEFNNNSGGIDHIIQFPAGVVVYNGNTQVHDGTGNKYLHITSMCCKLVFTKANGVINIVENNGITL